MDKISNEKGFLKKGDYGMNKKWLSILLGTLMVGTSLAGCGQSGSDSAEPGINVNVSCETFGLGGLHGTPKPRAGKARTIVRRKDD